MNDNTWGFGGTSEAGGGLKPPDCNLDVFQPSLENYGFTNRESPLVLPPSPSQFTSQLSLCAFVHEGYLNLKNAQLDLIQELTQSVLRG